MSIFTKDFLSRVKPRGLPERPLETATEAENVPQQRPAAVEELARDSLKHSWRDDARWLEEHCAEEFGPVQIGCGPKSNCEPARPPPPPVEAQSPTIASESLQSVPLELPTLAPIPPLPGTFWQGVLHGNQDSLVSDANATRALRLVGDRVGMTVPETEAIAPLRVVQLRKLFHNRFGPAEAERGMHQLWRKAPASPGAPRPNENQSRYSPGVWECPRSMPAWRRELHQEVNGEQRLLEELGGWCG